ncbi:MAG: imelysin family protein, partial [Sulfurimonas sp.]|nr:imelysin family protein [Sulfurimonas sp.]
MTQGNKIIGSVVLATLLTLGTTGCGGGGGSDATPTTQTQSISVAQKTAALTTYADIALANYTQAHTDAIALQSAVKAFTDAPTDETMAAAKAAWKTARESYGTTEAFRLSNGPIDAESGFAASW